VTVIDFSAFIGRLATSSGETILPFFRTSLSIDNKSASNEFDPVTEADRAAEAVMRRLIKASFPQHGIVGEEFGNERENADYVWVLDPIDGTKSFISGFPIWGTLIALLHKGLPVFGMMHQPFIGERFSGDNASAHYQGPSGERRLSVRRCAALKDATSYTTWCRRHRHRLGRQARATRRPHRCRGRSAHPRGGAQAAQQLRSGAGSAIWRIHLA
jgi:myo-inositol-1(or 4)-monophosphatase